MWWCTPLFNLSTWKAESGESLKSRPDLSTEGIQGQPELHRETLFGGRKKRRKERGEGGREKKEKPKQSKTKQNTGLD